jgi:hypothetical protein
MGERMNQIEQTLYDRANKIVGWVGNPSDSMLSETGQEFLETVIMFRDHEELLEKWEKWIEAYKITAKNTFINKVSDSEKPVKIYWRMKPEIMKDKQALYARLLISNADEVDSVLRFTSGLKEVKIRR